MVFLVSLGAFLIFAVCVLYWLLGTNRYGGDRPACEAPIDGSRGRDRRGGDEA